MNLISTNTKNLANNFATKFSQSKNDDAKTFSPVNNTSNTNPQNTTNPFRVLPQGYIPVNFTARAEDNLKPVSSALKKKMQYAEAVVNNVKNQYGSISPSKVLMTFQSKRTPQQESWLDEKQSKLEDLRQNYPSTDDNTKFIDKILENVKSKDNNLANCYEYAKLTEVALAVNGFKNVKTVKLVGYTNPEFKSCYDLDHTFVVVNGKFDDDSENVSWNKYEEKFGKNAFVVDPWLGIVDTVENAMKVYDKAWKNIPHYQEIKGYSIEESDSLEFSSAKAKKLAQKYPELVVDKASVDFLRYEK